MSNNHLIVMAGGVGSRLWPMSTPEMPKQFIDVLGVGKSLLQLTVERFSEVIPMENVWVVTSKRYKETVMAQLPQVPEEQVLSEPCMRNTAPCIAYVTYKIRSRHGDANLVFSPADHVVLDTHEFGRMIGKGLAFTANTDAIVTLGVKPTRPETGYGYIKAGEAADGMIRKVEAFKEKPDEETARRYVGEGGYYWNSGIFIWNAATVEKEFECHVPALASTFSSLRNVYYTREEQAMIDAVFPGCENISIDYAVMEKSGNSYVCPVDFGWSDLGTWGSLHTHLPRDERGNAVIGGNVKLVECVDCVVRVQEMRQAVVEGLEHCIVVEHGGRLLVCRKDEEQHIKDWVGK